MNWQYLSENLETYLPFLLGYAEIHYHLKFLYPRYFLKEPEIISDVPIRCIESRSAKIPILIIVKDSHLFPIHLVQVTVETISISNNVSAVFKIDQHLKQKYYSQILLLDASRFKKEQNVFLNVKIDYTINGEMHSVLNDNYPHLQVQPFRCFWTEQELPYPKNWFLGEPHYHSIHTSDQVEFGADINSTKIMAKAMGLSWFFVTDHSYDLDDEENDFCRNDPELPIWKKMQKSCRDNDQQNFRIIAGEEVSIGNANGRNVHLLAINHPDFIEGSGDSAERWFQNNPQHSIAEIKKLHTQENLFIAAHPFEKVPFLQKLTLRRGNWQQIDFVDGGINFLQAINGNERNEVENSIEEWVKLLLAGNRYFLVAGNDAHGNFNVMRQIKKPFWKLFSSHKQTFGNFFTAFQHNSNDPIQGLKAGKIIVSNGPFLSFELICNTKKYAIGSVISARKAKLIFDFATTAEFGKIKSLDLHVGNCAEKTEQRFEKIENMIEIDLPERGFIRLSAVTEKGAMAFTNPIWTFKE